MAAFISYNIGTILTGLVLFVIIAAIIFKIRLDKNKNKCAGCPYSCGIRDYRTEYHN